MFQVNKNLASTAALLDFDILKQGFSLLQSWDHRRLSGKPQSSVCFGDFHA